jgi:hypothetical protein
MHVFFSKFVGHQTVSNKRSLLNVNTQKLDFTQNASFSFYSCDKKNNNCINWFWICFLFIDQGINMALKHEFFWLSKIDSFLDLIEHHPPVGGMEWNNIIVQHNKNFPIKLCLVEKAKHKVSLLYGMQPSTGQPFMSPQV